MFYALGVMAAADAAARAAEAAARTGGAQVEAARAATAATLLTHHVERLLMITEALWNMLKEQHGYTDEDLMERVRQIDMRDGRLDGKVASSGVKTCPSCKRPVSGRHTMCIYCGRAIGGDLFDR